MSRKEQRLAIKKGEVKFTGNIAVDAIRACLKAHKLSIKKPKTINLCSTWWILFATFLQEKSPETEFGPDGVQFNDVLIRKGTKFMREKLEVDY